MAQEELFVVHPTNYVTGKITIQHLAGKVNLFVPESLPRERDSRFGAEVVHKLGDAEEIRGDFSFTYDPEQKCFGLEEATIVFDDRGDKTTFEVGAREITHEAACNLEGLRISRKADGELVFTFDAEVARNSSRTHMKTPESEVVFRS